MLQILYHFAYVFGSLKVKGECQNAIAYRKIWEYSQK